MIKQRTQTESATTIQTPSLGISPTSPIKVETTKTQRVRIHLYANKLTNVAGLFKGTSDPYAVVVLFPNSEKARLLGVTEVIKNCLSPRWTTFFDLDYSMGGTTRFNVGVYDEKRKARRNKQMGSATFDVGEILGSRGNVKAKKLLQGGYLFVRVTAAPPKLHGLLHLGLRGIDLKNVDGMFQQKCDPFLEISSQVFNGCGSLTWQTVYRSKHVMDDLNPIWPNFTLDIGALCGGGDQEHPILFEVFDRIKLGKHKRIGQFQTTVRALLDAETPSAAGETQPDMVDVSRAFHLRIPRQMKKEMGKVEVNNRVHNMENDTEGKIVVTRARIENDAHIIQDTPIEELRQEAENVKRSRPTFVDYLAGGCELELFIAIDFTANNGDPRKPESLHYVHKDGVSLNDYEKSFTSVGSIIGKYDSNQLFPVWGFGATFGGLVNNCFQVGDELELKGLGEALNAYRRVFQTCFTMSSTTVFAECIDKAAQQARLAQQRAEQIGKQTYSILLILTSGAVSGSEIELTKQSLCNANDAPLSIVIVGLGSADFSQMIFLDKFASFNRNQRDIVKFVEFNKFAHDKSALTRETLDEIPGQLVEFFYDYQQKLPLPPLGASQLDDVQGDEAGDEDVHLTIDYNPNGEIVWGDTVNLPIHDDTQFSNATTFTAGLSRDPSKELSWRSLWNPHILLCKCRRVLTQNHSIRDVCCFVIIFIVGFGLLCFGKLAPVPQTLAEFSQHAQSLQSIQKGTFPVVH